MRIIDEAKVRSLVSLGDARDAVRSAFCALADGQVVAPNEMAMHLSHGGELHVKGAYLGGEVIAFKAATGQFPTGGNNGFSAVIDAASGAPLAFVADGGWLTELRTAAASAVTAQALARSDASRLAILGGGVQAGFQVEAMRDAMPIESVGVWSRTRETAIAFAATHGATAVENIGEAVRDADIVICCTPSRDPLLEFEMLKPGAHVVAMGADMVGKRELGSSVLRSCDLLVCDAVDVAARVGELQHAAEQVSRATSLGDVLTGRALGRSNGQQITVADLCGLGIQDAAMAELVMERLD